MGEFRDVNILQGGAVSVGFDGVTVLEPLKAVMAETLTSVIKNTLHPVFLQIEKNTTESVKNDKKEQEQQKNIHNSMDKYISKQEKLNAEISKNLREISDDNKKRRDIWKGYLKTIADISTKILANVSEDSQKMYNIMRDVESAGGYLNDGLKTLYDSAQQAGMSLEEMTGYFKSHSQSIAKLNQAYGNGAKVFSEALSNIKDEYKMSHAEQVLALQSVIDQLSPTQLQLMKSEELKIRVDETARSMKMLSQATGKTIEQIKEEQNIKAQELRVKAWAATHQQEFNMLSQMGFANNKDLMDYIISNGSTINGDLALMMAGNQGVNAITKDVMSAIMTGRFKNMDDVKRILQANQSALRTANLATESLASSQQMFAGMARNASFNTYGVGAYDIANNLLNLNNNLKNIDDFKKNGSAYRGFYDSALQSGQKVSENIVGMENTKLYMGTGGAEGLSKMLLPLEKLSGAGNNILGNINNNTPDGIAKAIATHTAIYTSSAVGKYIGSRIFNSNNFNNSVDKFKDAVDKFADHSDDGKSGDSGLGVDDAVQTAGAWWLLKKYGLNVLKGAGGLGVLGTSVGLGDDFGQLMSDTLHDGNKTAAGIWGNTTTILGSAAGGAMIGSAIPIVGTGVGAILGTLVGVGKALKDTFYDKDYSSVNNEIKPISYNNINSATKTLNTKDDYLKNNYFTDDIKKLLNDIANYTANTMYTLQQYRLDNKLTPNNNNQTLISGL